MKAPKKRISPVLEMALGAPLMAAGAVGAFTLSTPVSHSLSLAAVLLGLVLACHGLRSFTSSAAGPESRLSRVLSMLARALPVAVVVASTCGVYWYLLLGEMPWSHDHPVHLFKAWQLGERLIPTGRLMGWSHLLWTGYPAETLYPMLGDLLVVVVRWTTLCMAPWPVAYAWTLLIVVLLYHLGIFAMGRRMFGPWAGAAAALFALLDRGAPREGSYYWTIHYGVWPMALGTALWFFALERLLALLERPTRGRFAAFAALQGLAVLGHPMTIMFSFATYPTAIVLHVLRAERRHIARPVWASVAACGLAACLAAFWYLPFLAGADFVTKVGGTWWTLPEVGDRLRTATLFDNTWTLPVALGLGGAVLAWAVRHDRGRDVTIMAGVLMLAASSTAFEMLDLGSVSEKLNIVHFRRFSYAIKMMWFLLAGFALSGSAGLAFGRTAGDEGRGAPGPARRWLWTALAIVVLVPFLESFLVAVSLRPLEEISAAKPITDQRNHAAFKDSNKWFETHTDPRDPFFRIAYEVGGSRHLFTAAPVFTGRPAINLPVDVPATSFTRHFRSNSASTMTFQNVRYAVALNDFLSKRKDLKQVHKKKHFRIYEVEGYSPDPFTVEGEARVKLVEFGDERIRLDVSNPAPGDRLTLHVTHMSEWHASIGGKAVPIRIVEGNKSVRWLMSVPLTEEGVLEFRYERAAPWHIGLAISLFGLALVVFVAFGGTLGRRFWLALPGSWKAQRIAERASLPGLGVFAAACLGGLVWVLLSGEPQPGAYRLSDHLPDAQLTLEGEGKHYECSVIFDRRYKCSNGQTQWVYNGAKRSGKDQSRILSGILIRPFKVLHTVLRFPDVRLGRSLLVRCGTDYLDNSGKGNLSVFFEHGDDRIGKVSCPASGIWREHSLDTSKLSGRKGTLMVDIPSSPKRPPKLILDAWIVR
jgi:hypothetical protein